ncbi:hypothetical protein APHAL10511_002322 [Amanita phalloides]|nr:hypothetical protein APHAL10511_002322 [Amanita phalloides]
MHVSEITLVLEWDETTVNIIIELGSAGKARQEKSKVWDEEAETSVSIGGVDDKGNGRNELGWERRMETETDLVLSTVLYSPVSIFSFLLPFV